MLFTVTMKDYILQLVTYIYSSKLRQFVNLTVMLFTVTMKDYILQLVTYIYWSKLLLLYFKGIYTHIDVSYERNQLFLFKKIT